MLEIPRGLSSGLVPATRPLGLDRGNGAVCKITTEHNAVLRVDVLILSFCFHIRALLRSIVGDWRGWGHVDRSHLNQDVVNELSS